MRDPAEIQADTSYGWGWRSKGTALSAAIHLKKLNVSEYPGKPKDMSHETLVCAGWADLYYIPVGYIARFVTLMHNYLSHHVFHEVAVPTVIHLMTNSDVLHEEVLTDCFGCCCCGPAEDVDPLTLLQRFDCGHRIDLSNNRSLRALGQLLTGGLRGFAHHLPDP